ncbi:MAG: GspH/FimT family pseudopilin [Rhodanobacter sp.]|jgi:type IV fimbrial biogenesis protein FimT
MTTTAWKRQRVPDQGGFSLIEQVMVLAIAGALLGVALPSLHHLLSRNRVQEAQGDFLAALRHSRSTAAITGKRTVFCPSVDGRHCSGANQWDSGWLIGPDIDGDHQPDGNPSYTRSRYASGLRITSSNGRRDVRFQADGSAGGSNLTLLFCQPGRASETLSVVVSNAGRVRGAPATAAQAARCRQGD